MKGKFTPLLSGLVYLGLLTAVTTRADTQLTIKNGPLWPCLDYVSLYHKMDDAAGFGLPGVSGAGSMQSSADATVPTGEYFLHQ